MNFLCERCFGGWCLVLVLSITIIIDVADAHSLGIFQTRPPPAKYQFNKKALLPTPAKVQRIAAPQPDIDDETNVWEESGLFEGDIMTYGGHMRNGISLENRRWPNATVPYFIDDSFTNEEVEIILGAMQEYHDRTCVRFRPYTKNDTNWIEVKSDYSGCWSSVGMRTGGQVVNLNSPRCVRHGVAVHELMHAIGFFHQQSSADRDEHVHINWENIREGREMNFKKYNSSAVNDFEVGYDYDSVMHYGAKAFSKNGQRTIEPLDPDAKLGQRIGLSEKDVMKLNLMYESTCHNDTVNILDLHQLEPENPDDLLEPEIPDDGLTKVRKWVHDFIGY